MKEINERMKAFITAYMPLANKNREKKAELDKLSEEVEILRKEDEASETRYQQILKDQFGITNNNARPERAKDPLYLAKERQREEMQEEYEKDTANLRAMAAEQKTDISKEIYQLKEEVRDLETKYLLNAQKKLQIAEQKIALGGSEEQMKLFQKEQKEMSEAVANIKKGSKEKVEQLEHLSFFLQTISDIEAGKYDFKKLEKAIKKLETMNTLEDAKEAMKDAIVPIQKAKETEPPKPGQEPPKPGQGEPPKPGQEPPKPGQGEPPKPGQEPPKPGEGEPPKPGQEPPKPGEGEPPKPGQEPPKPGQGEPPKPGQEPPKPGTGEPPKPEGAIKSIRYSALDNTYEMTFENGAKKPYTVQDKALREFKKEDKRYLKELLKGIGAYKKCDIGLFKALREIDRENGTHNFDAYIALLNGEESSLENITYDAEKMNDPLAFNKQETEARRVMTRMMSRVRKVDGIEVVGLKRTRLQRFVDFFTGANKPKQITGRQPELIEEEGDIEKPQIIEQDMVEEQEGPIEKPQVIEKDMTEEEAKRVREAFGSRRSQRGREWADSLHVDGAPEEKEEHTLDEVIEDVKSWNEQHKEDEAQK